jgi:drug/metabolite transporter (DMT)-like permease
MSSPATRSASVGSLGAVALLGTLTFFWGTNWPIMKIVLGEMPVWWFRTVCLFGGGFSLMAIAVAGGQVVRLRRAEIGPLLLCTALNIIGWHLCSAYGVSLMPAGRASIIAFTMPVWASLMSVRVLGEPMTGNKIVALVLGVAGLAVLIGPDLWVLQAAPVGALFMLGAAVCWAAGTVSFKRPDWSASVVALTAWQLILGGIPISIGAVLFEGTPDFVSAMSPTGWYALAFVIAFPMIFCQWAYMKSVRLFPASLAAISTLGIPVIGTYSSALILDEPVGWREFGALVLVISALASVTLLPALRRK